MALLKRLPDTEPPAVAFTLDGEPLHGAAPATRC